MNVIEQLRRQAKDINAIADELERREREFGLLPPADPRERRAFAVLAAVCRVQGLGITIVLSTDRTQEVSEARFVVMWCLRHLLGMTYVAIGKTVGRDHGAVMNGLDRVSEWRESDPRFRARLEAAMTAAKIALAELEGFPA